MSEPLILGALSILVGILLYLTIRAIRLRALAERRGGPPGHTSQEGGGQTDLGSSAPSLTDHGVPPVPVAGTEVSAIVQEADGNGSHDREGTASVETPSDSPQASSTAVATPTPAGATASQSIDARANPQEPYLRPEELPQEPAEPTPSIIEPSADQPIAPEHISKDSQHVLTSLVSEPLQASSSESRHVETRPLPRHQKRQLRRSKRGRRFVEKTAPEYGGSVRTVEVPADDNYVLWNRTIGEHCLGSADGGTIAFLVISPRTLAAAWAAIHRREITDEEAERGFVQAVSSTYHRRVLSDPAGLRVLRRRGPDGLPQCIAFLALSVLAAYEMRTDEERSANAYYARLALLLGVELERGVPRGFDVEEFGTLWAYLRTWLAEERRIELAFPPEDARTGRFVALPLTHAPLRRVDLERLPEFFSRSGYSPGSKVPLPRLEADLMRWMTGGSPFTEAGTAALRDARRPAVCAQIESELEAWDGELKEGTVRRTAPVEILSDPFLRRIRLSYLPRRPSAFPAVFDDGTRLFEASSDGWYAPLLIPREEGRLLADGFEWHMSDSRLAVVLRRPPARIIVLGPSEFTGFISRHGLVLREGSQVLCVEQLKDEVSAYLGEATGTRCNTSSQTDLPEGWVLFQNVIPVRRPEPPAFSSGELDIETSADIKAVGGLKLGRRQVWALGAPPRVFVSGEFELASVAIDGEAVPVGEGGELLDGGRLAAPGLHQISAARVQRRVEIAEPTLAPFLMSEAHSHEHEDSQRTPVALPQGLWYLVGSRPGEVCGSGPRGDPPELLYCPFKPIWAISRRPGSAFVFCLVEHPTGPVRRRKHAGGALGEKMRLRRWSSAIRVAEAQNLEPMGLSGQASAEVAAVWQLYVSEASHVAQLLRRRRT